MIVTEGEMKAVKDKHMGGNMLYFYSSLCIFTVQNYNSSAVKASSWPANCVVTTRWR